MESHNIHMLLYIPVWFDALRVLLLIIGIKIDYKIKNTIMHIKTHGSELRGQEEAGLHDEPVSYLQVAPL